MPCTLLFDADIVCYQMAAMNEFHIDWGDGVESTEVDEDHAREQIERWFEEIYVRLKATDYRMCFSDGTKGYFRHKLNPHYKEQRRPLRKPTLLKFIQKHIQKEYKSIEKPQLEADDLMGILSTSRKIMRGKKVIVSIDKDMESIPGWIFNWNRDKNLRRVTKAQADRRFYKQILSGDPTDNFFGIPGIGPKKSEKILLEAEEKGMPYWDAILEAYHNAGLTEREALMNARMARILRSEDYDWETGKIKLWKPSGVLK